MLSAADTNIEDILSFFASRGIDVALLSPTETGMKKSIMDATAPVRSFLKRNHLHDFESQDQGPEHKVLLNAYLVTSQSLHEAKVSLYRPLTKKGDPRIWISRIGSFCEPHNVLALTCMDGTIYVFNMSDTGTIASLREEYAGFAWTILDHLAAASQSIALELLRKLISIHRLGFVETCTTGDTGVGMTLEKLLGITPNASIMPDYKGIELKAHRGSIGAPSRNRTNLFSQTPDWGLSNLHSGQELLDAYGYIREGRRQLYCTVEARRANTQGLYFYVDEEDDFLRNRYRVSDREWREVVLWQLEVLRTRLREKHPETFWVKAESKLCDGREFFRYDEVLYTKSPNIGLLSTLLAQSIITMDYTISQKPKGVRDHGYLFKIKPENLSLLFPEPQLFNLEKPEYTTHAIVFE